MKNKVLSVGTLILLTMVLSILSITFLTMTLTMTTIINSSAFAAQNNIKNNTKNKIQNNTQDKIKNLTFISRQQPPFAHEYYDINGGILTTVTQKITNLDEPTINILRWDKDLNNIELDDNSVIMGLTKTKDNEDKFIWVGPITSKNIKLMSFKEHNKEIGSLKELQNYTVGVDILRPPAFFSPNNQTLNTDNQTLDTNNQSFNPENLSKKIVIGNNIDKLIFDEIDFLAYPERTVYWIAGQMDHRPDEFKTHFLIEKRNLYYAFPKNIDKSIPIFFKNSLENLKQKDYIEKVYKKYYSY